MPRILDPPRNAVTPVKTISVPYPLPYAHPALSFHGNPRIRTSLNGPLATFPIPLPAAKHAKTILGSAEARFLVTSRMMPGHALVKLPAKNPYMRQNTYRGARDIERPQTMKTERVVPMLEIRIQVVTCQRSTMEPMATQPKTEATLKRIIVSALNVPDAPILPISMT